MDIRAEASAGGGGDAGEFGYRQELHRVLRLFAVFSVAFSVVSITTGIFLNYAFGLTHLGPVSIWLWPIAAVGQTLVALILAELSTRIPLAGANYQWAARLVGPRYGYLVGALGILYSAVGMPGIMLLGAAPLLVTALHGDASNGRLLFGVAVLLIVLAFGINIISVQLAAKVNNVAVVTEIIGTVVLAALLFGLFVGHAKPVEHGFEILGQHATQPGQSLFYGIVLASLIGVYTLVGFEAAADMGEETVDARRTIPRAILLSVIVSGVLGMITLIGFTVAIPDPATIGSAEVPLAEISTYWLGSTLTSVFLLVVVFSMFALTVVAAAANARLIYAMARDNMLPGSRLLRGVSAGRLTPLPALVTALVICLALMSYGYLNGNAFGTLVGATALIPYVVYFLTVIAYGARRHRLDRLPGAFHLGRWATPVFVLALIWLLTALAALVLPSEFRSAVWVTLGGLVLAAFWYVVGLRARLRDGAAGPPRLPDAAESVTQVSEGRA
ncbi:MAG TPA: amino acid permease [Pseudonocardia sp.]|uniref:APC family permease n=1 Tax=Pseudonocardia sp. TaxID=60912 RepID=UPI002BA24999|nr:amino acid permease [Pseudonocardia sp.]HTF51677.1 amino acid permease [Pseudonocardia sp.]